MLGSTTLALALGLLLQQAPTIAIAASSSTISGSGTISVLTNTTSHSISVFTASPAQAVGCLNAAGKVVPLPRDDNDNDKNSNSNGNGNGNNGDLCAVFTTEAYHVSTSEGFCSFNNASQPANTDDVYGASVHALSCWAHETVATDVQFYTVGGLAYSFIGQGDADLYYDIPALPESSTDAIDLWYYVWGGQETGVPAGHYQAVLLWEPTL